MQCRLEHLSEPVFELRQITHCLMMELKLEVSDPAPRCIHPCGVQARIYIEPFTQLLGRDRLNRDKQMHQAGGRIRYTPCEHPVIHDDHPIPYAVQFRKHRM